MPAYASLSRCGQGSACLSGKKDDTTWNRSVQQGIPSGGGFIIGDSSMLSVRQVFGGLPCGAGDGSSPASAGTPCGAGGHGPDSEIQEHLAVSYLPYLRCEVPQRH